MWQPLIADLSKPPELLGVDEDKVGLVARDDGTEQLTLAGWPLYRHVGAHADLGDPGRTAPKGSGSPSRRTGPRPADPVRRPPPQRRSSRAGCGGRPRGRTRDTTRQEDDMARIPAVPAARAGPLGRLVYRLAERRFGAVPEPLAVVAHHPAAVPGRAARRARRTSGRPGGCPAACASWPSTGWPPSSAARGASTSAPCCSAWTGSTSSGCRTSTTTRPARSTPSRNGWRWPTPTR